MSRNAWFITAAAGGFLLLAFFCVVAVIIAVSLSDNDDAPARANPPTIPAQTTRIEYVITTSGDNHPITLTYENGDGNTEQREAFSQNNEWRVSYDMAVGEFVYVSAQNGRDSGTIECEIIADGSVIEQAESSGAYVIATCSGSVP